MFVLCLHTVYRNLKKTMYLTFNIVYDSIPKIKNGSIVVVQRKTYYKLKRLFLNFFSFFLLLQIYF